ncbi:MAG: hypothetical protein RMH84_06640 [Sulfolobales archaeon]|nr:hypothetical protein [Sulfolobales archaeon]MCX8209085.1 hypothetical protein [Sulfolobales archaeon]MDW8011248.1 hypothetical protein [Sulfolobales archaeon]
MDSSRVDERIRQILRHLLEFEEKYSMRSSRLTSERQTARNLMTESDDVKREIERWVALYAELVRLDELKTLYRRKSSESRGA